ncbi:hypothetical protein CR203_21605 [Salipaludibacillus neizhouensis]|uniref:Uncharacterized protein n=1 Tax=Salipaludibacillus neizhouensis TaxID=885475 RepID=A0A3A9K2Z1_9BACI|nr:hypothetical protein [Salipaludibacillus neizhouensis]RKL65270.1 hypothetical protein CR203_21605 [Salipaludibacillus neizhouensis]
MGLNGFNGFKDTRVERSGKPHREVLDQEKYARLEAQNNLLKAENELVKKIDLAERMMKRKK